MNNILIFIFLGIVQGLTEPLPISSSGHLLIFQYLLGFDIPGVSFEAFINFGSTIAIVIYFRKKIKILFLGAMSYFFKLLKKEKTSIDNKIQWDYFLKIVVASIPLGVMGILLLFSGYEGIENIKVVGLSLFITAISLIIVSKIKGEKSVEKMTYVDALIIGVFQAIALMPGISRSGMTLVGALVVGIKNDEAFEFSFMMFIPASIAALLFSTIDIITSPDISQYLIGYLISFVLAGIFTFIGLHLLKKVVIGNKLYYFAIYCFIVSLSIIFIF